MKKKITKIDLWTETALNTILTEGCLIDGFSDGNIPYDKIKVLMNCNNLFEMSGGGGSFNLKYEYRRHAVLFYKNDKAVRLAVLSDGTDVMKSLKDALSQNINEAVKIEDLVRENKIILEIKDLKQEHKTNNCKNIADIASCDRESLLADFLKGSYTADETGFVTQGQWSEVEYFPHVCINLKFETDNEEVDIEHIGLITGRLGKSIRNVMFQKSAKISQEFIEKSLKEFKIEYSIVK